MSAVSGLLSAATAEAIPRTYNFARDIFERNNTRRDRIAYIDQSGSWTYQQLRQRAEVGFLQRRPYAREPITVQPPVINPLLEIDTHDAERRQRAPPVEARIDVLGADLVNGLVHDDLPKWRAPEKACSQRQLYSFGCLRKGELRKAAIAGPYRCLHNARACGEKAR